MPSPLAVGANCAARLAGQPRVPATPALGPYSENDRARPSGTARALTRFDRRHLNSWNFFIVLPFSRKFQEATMFTNGPPRHGHRIGALKDNTQLTKKVEGEEHWTKRHKTTGQFHGSEDRGRKIQMRPQRIRGEGRMYPFAFGRASEAIRGPTFLAPASDAHEYGEVRAITSGGTS
jgi:hypothetical protein